MSGRWAQRRDDNELGIVAILEAHGCQVSKIKQGDFDVLACAPGGEWIPLEIKSRLGKLTPAEAKFERECARNGTAYQVVRSELEALAAVGLR